MTTKIILFVILFAIVSLWYNFMSYMTVRKINVLGLRETKYYILKYSLLGSAVYITWFSLLIDIMYTQIKTPPSAISKAILSLLLLFIAIMANEKVMKKPLSKRSRHSPRANYVLDQIGKVSDEIIRWGAASFLLVYFP